MAKKIPKINLSKTFKVFKKLNTSQILVILLVLAAFLIGVLFTKIQYLEKSQGNQAQAPTQPVSGKLPPLHVAKEIGMDAGKFKSCLESGKYTQKVKDDTSAGTTAGTSGTPTTFINGQAFVGALPYSDFKTAMDQELANLNAPLPSGTRVQISEGSFPALGKSDAPVTVIEFADFQCPFCEKFYTDVEKNLIKDYVNAGKARFIFRNFAFLGEDSNAAAEGAFCAQEQGKFWEYHNFLYEHQGPENSGTFSKENLL